LAFSYVNCLLIGIGRELCKVLAKNNAQVIALSRSPEHLETLKKEFPSNIETIAVDLSNWEEARRAVQTALPIDGLVNNAAIAILNTFLNVRPEDIDKFVEN